MIAAKPTPILSFFNQHRLGDLKCWINISFFYPSNRTGAKPTPIQQFFNRLWLGDPKYWINIGFFYPSNRTEAKPTPIQWFFNQLRLGVLKCWMNISFFYLSEEFAATEWLHITRGLAIYGLQQCIPGCGNYVGLQFQVDRLLINIFIKM